LTVSTGKAESVVNGACELVPAAFLHGLKGDDFSSTAFDDIASGRYGEVVLVLTIRRGFLDKAGVDSSTSETHREVVLAFQPINFGPVNLNVLQRVTRFEVQSAAFDFFDLSGDEVPVFEDDAVIISLCQYGRGCETHKDDQSSQVSQ